MSSVRSALSSPQKPLLRAALSVFSALVVGSFSTQAVQAQSAGQTFFYVGDKRYPLNVSSKWAGLQLKSNSEAATVQKELRADGDIDATVSPRLYQNKKMLLVPVDAAKNATSQTRSSLNTRLRSTKGVERTMRILTANSAPVVETDEFVVKFKPGITPAARKALLAKYGSVEKEPLYKMPDGFLVTVTDPARNATDVANAIYESGQTIFSHPNYIWPKEKRFIPNDPLYPSQWHLNNTGESSGTIGADIKAEAAWNITRGGSNITVAVIDEGIDLEHEEFQGKLVPGYDFLDGDDDPSAPSEQWHGTAVAGLVAANGNNGAGISGIAPNVKLMPIRLIGGATTFNDERNAFIFAADNGADVINCSWGPEGGVAPLPPLTQEGIDYAADNGRGGKGCVIFFAAGNFGKSSDSDGYASYSKVISVVASTNYDVLAGYSSFGSSVDLTAPGGGQPGTANIVTTDPTGIKGFNAESDYHTNFTGTSAAAPLAAGVGALVLSVNPGLTRAQVQNVLQTSTDKIGSAPYPGGRNSTYGYGRVNALKALQNAGTLYTVSGTVTLSGGAGLADVELTNSPINGYATTAANGTYSLQIPASTITITPRKTGYFFTPTSRTLTISGAAANVNFTALPLNINLLEPLSNASVTGTVNLRAKTTLDSVVQRIDFGRRAPTQSFTRTLNVAIPDGTIGSGATTPGVISDSRVLAGSGTVEAAAVTVNISHEWIGDLIVKLIPPSGSPVVLHAREGRGTSIAKTYQVPLDNVTLAGTWKLEVSDNDETYVGTFNSWGMTVFPTWTTIGSSAAPVSGEWKSTWNSGTVTPGTYDIRARAITANGPHDAINTGIVVASSYSISGRVVDSAGTGVAGVVIARSGSSTTVQTDSSGNYTFSGFTPGTYTITPALSGRTFTPVNRSVTVGTANVGSVNFTASTADTTAPTVTVTTPANGAFIK